MTHIGSNYIIKFCHNYGKMFWQICLWKINLPVVYSALVMSDEELRVLTQ